MSETPGEMDADVAKLMKHAHDLERRGRKMDAELTYSAASEIARMRLALKQERAAAPELYEALQSIMHSADNLLRLVDELRERGEVDHWQSIQCADLAADVNIARNALLKASGGSDV